MKIQMKDILYWFIIIMVAILGLVGSIKPPRTIETIHKDTITIKEPIYIEGPGKITYRTKFLISEKKDTVFIIDSSKYISCIDTNIKKVNIKTCYEFPDNRFLIDLKFQPDTIKVVSIIEKPPIKYEQQKAVWWHDAIKVGGGVVLGFLIGRVK